MALQTKTKKMAILMANPNILFGKKKYLFVCSHMRSRSSVLSHILGSNPRICGYKELHQPYIGPMSLLRMRLKLAIDLSPDFKNKYLLDKILNNYEISDAILVKAQPKILFLLREPEETIKSIINMGQRTGVKLYKNPEKVTSYYCKRLQSLEALSFKAGEGNLYIDSKDLVDDSKNTLEKIGNWLQLEEPLKTTYSTFRDTGVIAYGDPLEDIKSGVLKATVGHPHIQIPEYLLKEAKEAYQKCRLTLINNVK